MLNKKVYIDLGHGGIDGGAIGINKTKESDITSIIGNKLKPLLIEKEYDVRLSSDVDTTISLSQRSQDANTWGADILVSLHCNALDGNEKGVETIVYEDNNDLAMSIHGNILDTGLYTINRGIQTKNLHIVRETKMVSCLVNLAFIDNIEDYNILMSNLDKYATAIYKGIQEYFENIIPQ